MAIPSADHSSKITNTQTCAVVHFTFVNNLIESGTGPILASMGAADNVTVAHNTYPGTRYSAGQQYGYRPGR